MRDLQHFAGHEQLHLHLIRPFVAEVLELIDWLQADHPELFEAAARMRDCLKGSPGEPRVLSRYLGIDPATSLAEWREAGERLDSVSGSLLALEKAGKLPARKLVLADRRWRCDIQAVIAPLPTTPGERTDDWLTVTDAGRLLVEAMADLGIELGIEIDFDIGDARPRISAAAKSGDLQSNGAVRSRRRIDPCACAIWVREFKAKQREKHLNARTGASGARCAPRCATQTAANRPKRNTTCNP